MGHCENEEAGINGPLRGSSMVEFPKLGVVMPWGIARRELALLLRIRSAADHKVEALLHVCCCVRSFTLPRSLFTLLLLLFI